MIVKFITNLIYGSVDPHPIFTEMDEFDRRSDDRRTKFLIDQEAKLSAQSTYEQRSRKGATPQQEAESLGRQFFYQLKRLLFIKYRTLITHDLSALERVTLKDFLGDYSRLYSLEKPEWQKFLDLLIADRTTSAVFANALKDFDTFAGQVLADANRERKDAEERQKRRIERERFERYGFRSHLMRVEAPPRPYSRSNQFGVRFSGTELLLMNANEGAKLTISFEGVTLNPDIGDLVVVISADQEILGERYPSPVIFINRSSDELVYVYDVMRKIAGGDGDQLAHFVRAAEDYMRRELKVEVISISGGDSGEKNRNKRALVTNDPSGQDDLLVKLKGDPAVLQKYLDAVIAQNDHLIGQMWDKIAKGDTIQVRARIYAAIVSNAVFQDPYVRSALYDDSSEVRVFRVIEKRLPNDIPIGVWNAVRESLKPASFFRLKLPALYDDTRLINIISEARAARAAEWREMDALSPAERTKRALDRKEATPPSGLVPAPPKVGS